MGLGAELAALGTEAEKTENFCASFVLWHDGHSGSADPRTSFSKLLLQSSQTYSNIGMKDPHLAFRKIRPLLKP